MKMSVGRWSLRPLVLALVVTLGNPRIILAGEEQTAEARVIEETAGEPIRPAGAGCFADPDKGLARYHLTTAPQRRPFVRGSQRMLRSLTDASASTTREILVGKAAMELKSAKVPMPLPELRASSPLPQATPSEPLAALERILSTEVPSANLEKALHLRGRVGTVPPDLDRRLALWLHKGGHPTQAVPFARQALRSLEDETLHALLAEHALASGDWRQASFHRSRLRSFPLILRFTGKSFISRYGLFLAGLAVGALVAVAVFIFWLTARCLTNASGWVHAWVNRLPSILEAGLHVFRQTRSLSSSGQSSEGAPATSKSLSPPVTFLDCIPRLISMPLSWNVPIPSAEWRPTNPAWEECLKKLQIILADCPERSITLASASRGEGAVHFGLPLALGLAALDYHCLLIRPHDSLHPRHDDELVEWMTSSPVNTVDPASARPGQTVWPNLDLLPLSFPLSATPPPKDLIRAWRRTQPTWRSRYDLTVIDLPPLATPTDLRWLDLFPGPLLLITTDQESDAELAYLNLACAHPLSWVVGRVVVGKDPEEAAEQPANTISPDPNPSETGVPTPVFPTEREYL